MAVEKHGILGQVAPVANTDTVLIAAVGVGRKVTITTLSVANTSGANTTYRINSRINGAAVSAGNQIAPDVPLSASQADGITWGICLGAGDILSVRASTAGVTFTAFGVEEDVV